MSAETTITGDAKDRQVFIQSHETLERCRQLPVARKLYIKGIGSVVTSDNFSVERPKGISDYIIIFGESGRGELEIGERRWDIQDGQFMLTRPDVPHTFKSVSSSPWVFFWLHFSGSSAGEYADMLKLDEDNPLLYVGDLNSWVDCFNELYARVSSGWSDMDLTEASTGLAQLLTCTGGLRREQNPRSRLAETRVLKSIKYMTEHYMEPLSLGDLARQACLSIPQYGLLFKKYTGTSPARHLTQIRLRFACEQLKYTETSISDIGLSVGFEDPLYFSRLFRKNLGCSPSEFRKRSLL